MSGAFGTRILVFVTKLIMCKIRYPDNGQVRIGYHLLSTLTSEVMSERRGSVCLERIAPSLSLSLITCHTACGSYIFTSCFTSSLPKRKPYLFLSSCEPNLKCRPNILTCALETNSLWLKTISFTKQNLHPCNFVAPTGSCKIQQ